MIGNMTFLIFITTVIAMIAIFKMFINHDLEIRKLNAANEQKKLNEGKKELSEEEELRKIREELGL